MSGLDHAEVYHGDEGNALGWHVMSGEHLLESLQRVQAGEDADLVFAELWANAEHEHVESEDEDG